MIREEAQPQVSEVYVWEGVGQEANLAIDTFEKVENKSNGYQTQRCQLP